MREAVNCLCAGALLASGLLWAADRRSEVERRLENVAGMEPASTGQFLADLQAAVRSADAEAVAGMVHLPIVVCLDSQPTLVETEAQFCTRFLDIINERVRKAVAAQKFDDLFVRYNGCMIGSGEIWFNGSDIVYIGSCAPTSPCCERRLKYLEPKGREIVEPADRAELWTFLKRSGLWKEARQHTEVFSLPDEESCQLYHADVNNDGTYEYVVAYVDRGSGNYSGVHAVYGEIDGRLAEISFDDIVVRNQCPGGDMSDFHMHLGQPFLIVKDGVTFMSFRDGNTPHFYKWTPDDQIQKAPGLGQSGSE